MKQLFINRRIGNGHTRKLCKPQGYLYNQENVFSKTFPENGFAVSLRHFCPETDLDFSYEWICRAYAPDKWQQHGPVKQLEETYIQMLQSDFSQPFVILVNNEPVCLAEVYCGQFHEVSLYQDLQQKDYIIDFLPGPRKKKERYTLSHLIQTCLHHFFSYPEVGRVISHPNIWDKEMNEAMLQTGFHFLLKADTAIKTANLYEYCREHFLQQFP